MYRLDTDSHPGIEPTAKSWTRSVGRWRPEERSPPWNMLEYCERQSVERALVSPWLIVDVSWAVVRRREEGEFNPDRGELSAGVAGEKFWAGERDGGGTKGGMPRTERRRRRSGERERQTERKRERGGSEWEWKRDTVAAKGARGDEPELERWQSIDLVGFTVSFYLSLSFYISASPASLHTSYEGASALSLFQGFDFLPFGLQTVSTVAFFPSSYFSCRSEENARFSKWKLLGLRRRDEIRISLGLDFFYHALFFQLFWRGGEGGGGVSMGRDTRLNGRYWMPSFKILQLQRGEGFFSSVNLNMYVCK